MAPDRKAGWVLLPPEVVPPRWRARAVQLLLVPLVPEEMADLLADVPSTPALEATDERVAHLAALGLSAAAIADDLKISPRTVYRCLARLRRELGVDTAASLAGELSKRGFGRR